MRRKYIIIIVFMLLALAACQEVYTPPVSAGEEILVVDGLLTDQPGSCRIRLTQAIPFDEDHPATPVPGASVNIVEDDDREYELVETPDNPGEYFSSTLVAHPGHQYTLYVRTDDVEYRSTPQIMMPARASDTIFGEVMERGFPYKNNDGNILYKYYTGGNIQVEFRNITEGAKGFRLVYSFYVQYVASKPDELIPTTYYIWHKEDFSYEVNVTGSEFPLATDDVLYDLCFFPFDREYYSFVREWPDDVYSGGMNVYVVMIDEYRLNDDGWQYYKALKKLMDTEGKMFDPIAAQLPGNMICNDGSQNKVLGFFEVSAYSSRSYKLIKKGGDHSLIFEKTPSLKGVPKDGYMVDMRPPFWVY